MEWQPRQKRSRRRRRRSGFRWDRLALVVALAGLVVFGLVKLVGYGVSLAASRRASRQMQQIYYYAPTDTPALPTEAPTEAPVVAAEQLTEAPPAPTAAVAATQSPIPRLAAKKYPTNEKLQISNRFKELKKANKDVVGWLDIDRLLSEAVVQRDNVYYLDHDVNGNPNPNGAVFMDAAVSLKTRPYTILLYGHNMRSGAMFGSLRNFEKISFYHNAPFITFDSQYESGRYVIFAVGNIMLEEGRRNYIDFFSLMSANVEERQESIDTLIGASVHTCTVEVAPEDQLLVLVTCTEDDDERRVVAARRVREGESEEELKRQVSQSKSK